MIINDTFKTATLVFGNLAAGPIATAPLSVDIASSFNINQTAANIALTLPSPTNPLSGDRVVVQNIGTAGFTLNGYTIKAGEFGMFVWSGAAWQVMDGGRITGAVVVVAAIPAGLSTITHGLALPTGSFSSVVAQAYDANGSMIVFKRNTATDTANAYGINAPVALANITFYITPLA